MNSPKRTLAIAQLLVIVPAVIFMGALVARMLRPLQYEPAHTAQRIVMWYAERMWSLWLLLIALPVAVLLAGSASLLRNRSGAAHSAQEQQQPLAFAHASGTMKLITAETVAAGAVLVIVFVHMLAN